MSTSFKDMILAAKTVGEIRWLVVDKIKEYENATDVTRRGWIRAASKRLSALVSKAK